MAKAKRQKGNSTNNQAVLIGSVVAAAALGAYFMGTASGQRQAKRMKGWMVKMKGEVMDRLEDMKEVTEPVYQSVVDTVADAQAAAGKIPKSEIMAVAMDLKRQWNTIKRMTGMKSGAQPTRRATKRKPAKKAAKSRTARR